jgi:murein DD-endopeptidase MepM/ murein hydrolase activator NlpD
VASTKAKKGDAAEDALPDCFRESSLQRPRRRRFDRTRRWLSRRITFMVIPHSDRRIAHIQIHAVILLSAGALVAGLMLAFLALTTVFSGTEQGIVEKSVSLDIAKGSLDSLLGQVNGLMKIYGEFQGTMTGTLREMNLETGGGETGTGSRGDLARLDNAQEMSSAEVREVLDIKKLSKALSDSISPLNEISKAWKTQKQLLSDLPNLWPVSGGRSAITMGFGPNRDPLRHDWTIHPGVDIAGAVGLFVAASANGKVTDVRYDQANGMGATVEVEHKYGFRTRYANLGTWFVQPGDEVYQGQRIGTIGTTGETTAPRLHFEILVGTQILDPAGFLTVSSDSVQP